MGQYIQYLKYLLLHKWYVFWACVSLRASLIAGLLHDWDKFRYSYFKAYANHFYNPDGTKRSNPHRFSTDEMRKARLGHLRQKHHWQAWVIIRSNKRLEPIEIPKRYILEMVADWMSIGKILYGNENPVKWWHSCKSKMVFHPKTATLIESILYGKFGVF